MIGNLIPGLISLGVTPSTTSYESIASVTVGSGGTATVTFSSIPSTYTHLEVRALYGTSSATSSNLLRLNNDTGSNYARHYIVGSGSAASASAAATQTAGWFSDWGPGGVTTSPGAAVMQILDYTNTNKYKTVRILNGYDGNGSGYIGLYSALWQSTTAVNRIDILAPTSGTITQYSSFALYGIKGS